MKEKGYPIIINAREKIWLKNEIDFKEIVELAFGYFNPNGNSHFSVVFKKGPDTRKEGIMVKGDVVKVKAGMIFNITQTSRS